MDGSAGDAGATGADDAAGEAAAAVRKCQFHLRMKYCTHHLPGGAWAGGAGFGLGAAGGGTGCGVSLFQSILRGMMKSTNLVELVLKVEVYWSQDQLLESGRLESE